MDDLWLVRGLLPLLIILIPITGSILVYLAGAFSSRLRNVLVVGITGLVFILLIFIYPALQQQMVTYELQDILDYGLKFSIDMTGFLFAFLIAILWLLASIYAIDYMALERNQNRFYFFFLLVFGGSLGTVLAGNLFTLFVFFELMSLGSYVLVVHKEDPISLSAGKKYLFMSIAGGLALLMGIFLIYYYAGSIEIKSLTQQLEHLGGGRYLIAFFLGLGFGVKAGMIPVHIWLPDAHPVAPSPASALLSGIMIKVGVYGLIRTINLIFSPAADLLKASIGDWSVSSNLGYVLIIISLITMFGGAFLALFQVNMKKILAYSSVSQIGYILMGIGVAGYMGADGFMGLGAALYHIISHAFFKGSLFFTAGIIYVKTQKLDIHGLGGLYKRMPLTTVAFIIGMFGIIGMPGFTGYISKTLLHEAILEAYSFQGDGLLYYGEKLFKLTSTLTVAYFMKMLIPVFFGPPSELVKGIDEESFCMKFSVGILSAGIILFGLFPQLIVDHFILKSAGDFSFSSAGRIGEVTFWHSYALEGSFSVILAGMAVYLIFRVSYLFHLVLPKKWGFEYLFYRPLYRFFFLLSEVFVTLFDKKVDIAQQKTAQVFMYLIKLFVPLFDETEEESVEEETQKIKKERHPFLYRVGRFFSNLIDEGYVEEEVSMEPREEKTRSKNPDEEASKRQVRSLKEFLSHILYSNFRSEFDSVQWDIKNLDFGLFVIIVLLLLFIIIFFPAIYGI